VKLLNGSELAGFIKERQAQQVRSLKQSKKIYPHLAIIVCSDNPVIEKYISLKKKYGEDIGIDVSVYSLSEDLAASKISELNNDDSVHGIIVQLPLSDPAKTDDVINMVVAEKDVDALSNVSHFDPATPMAIMWLLAGYNIDLKDKKIVLVGLGRLVGSPLRKILEAARYDIAVVDEDTKNPASIILEADLVITAVGKPGLITSSMIKKGAIVVDAAVASEGGKLMGDVADEVYKRDDITITPRIGGVGPLTICALFDNVIRSAQAFSKN
jgi:methylenetetrahydrofolate dehydrogenase (NADP+) / methenyltetrahydrofolate cyclohydrolase